MKENHSDDPVSIEKLFPDLTPEKQREADEIFGEYLELMLRMYDRIRSDPQAYAQFKALTASQNRSTIQ